MNNKGLILTSSIIIGISILLSGGIYSFDTIQVGVVQKYNKFTGHMELCHLTDLQGNCQTINSKDLASVNSTQSVREFMTSPEVFLAKKSLLEIFRSKYSVYDDLTDKELVLSLYEAYKNKTGASLSLEKFQRSIGYLPDGYIIIKDNKND